MKHRLLSILAWVLLVGSPVYAHLPAMGVSSKYLNFVVPPGGSPAPQNLVLATNEHNYDWTASITTTSGGNWLKITPDQGRMRGILDEFANPNVNLNVTVTSNTLAAGVYYAKITITGLTIDGSNLPVTNSPQVIEVALNVTTTGQAAPGFYFTPQALSLEGVRGTARIPTQTFQVANAGGGALNWTAAVSTDTGGEWLSVTPASGSNLRSLTATAAMENLPVGTYTGRVTFTAPGAANSPQVVPVTFRVRDPLPATLNLPDDEITFVLPEGGATPPSQVLIVTNGGEGPLTWGVGVTSFNGGPWLSVTPSDGSEFGVLTVSIDPQGMTVGTYTGQIRVTAAGAVNSPWLVKVNLVIRKPQPTFSMLGIVSAASFQAAPVAPGEIISIFGTRLGPPEGVAVTFEDPGNPKLPTTLGGTRITFDGVPAGLFYVSNGQINLQVPYEVAGRGSTDMQVTAEGLDPVSMTLLVADAAPGIFTLDGSHAAAHNQDGTVNTPENPASAGQVVVLYLTGQGPLDINIPSGVPGPSAPPFPAPISRVFVAMNGLDAKVLFAGMAPGFVGLMQINAEIPRGAGPSSQVRVGVAVGFNQTPKAAFISVK